MSLSVQVATLPAWGPHEASPNASTKALKETMQTRHSKSSPNQADPPRVKLDSPKSSWACRGQARAAWVHRRPAHDGIWPSRAVPPEGELGSRAAVPQKINRQNTSVFSIYFLGHRIWGLFFHPPARAAVGIWPSLGAPGMDQGQRHCPTDLV